MELPHWRLKLTILVCVAHSANTASAGGWRWVWWTPSSLNNAMAVVQPPPTTFEYLLRAHPAARRFCSEHPLDPENDCWRIRDDTALERGDLDQALRSRGDREEAVRRALHAYDLRRSKVGSGAASPDHPHQQLGDSFNHNRGSHWSQKLADSDEAISAEDLSLIPSEFLLYLDGAKAFREGDLKTARRAWEQLLSLPADERHYRSVWAEWMIGKCEPDAKKARAHFRTAIDLAEGGFADSLRLSMLAARWIADDHERAGDHPGAFWLHYRAAVRGGERSLSRLYSSGFEYSNFKGDRHHGEALAAYLLLAQRTSWNPYNAEGGNFRKEHTSDAPKKGSLEFWLYRAAGRSARTPELSGILATVAYNEGNLALAGDILGRGTLDHNGHWITAKMAFLDHNPALALTHLEAAAPHFRTLEGVRTPREIEPKGAFWGMDFLRTVRKRRFFCDLAHARLAADDFPGAALAFFAGNSHNDAAHTLQNLLSKEEVLTFADIHLPDSDSARPPRRAIVALRRLIGARLASGGDHRLAREFFAGPERSRFDSYLAELSHAEDESLPIGERAEALWRAAVIRKRSADLFAVMEPPDCRTPNDLWPRLWRLDAGWPHCLGKPPSPPRIAFIQPSTEEFQRLKTHGPLADYRGFPRYDAAALAMRAAELLGNDSERGAKMLNDAGDWVKFKNPVWANRLYRRLATRYPATALGQAAAELHWFPPSD